MIIRYIGGLFCLKLLVVGSALFAQVATGAEMATIRAQELAAANVAIAHFKQLNRTIDLKHYEIELTRRRNELQIAFIADEPERNPPPHPRTGGGSIYGPDMTYIVSIPQLKIVRYNFQR